MKIISKFLFLFLLIFTLAGCGQGSKNISNEQNGGISSSKAVDNEEDIPYLIKYLEEYKIGD